ncbi:MAG: hypothetical protein ACOYL6_00185 [Bacteriovoracaceae bacterium]
MKYYFSFVFLFLLSLNARAMDVIVLSYTEKNMEVEIVQKLLKERFYIPENLISVEQSSNPCRKRDDVVIHLCFIKEVMKVMYVNQKVMKEVLGVFYETE